MTRATTILSLVVLSALAVALHAQDRPPASQPVTPAAQTRPAEDPEAAAERLIEELLAGPGGIGLQPLTAASQPSTESSQGAAPAELMQPMAAPGAMLVDRVGRLVKDPKSEWWLFVFESERNILREPPLRILPNRWLETMEEVSAGGTRPGVKFRVSGELTEYRGTRYILLRKALVERNLGAL